MKPKLGSFASDNYTIQALQRGMKVLDTLLDARTPLKLEEICAITGLPKSTAFRIVVNLLRGQYLTETDEGYWLGLKLLRFGALVEEKLDLKQQARLPLLELRNQVNETVHLAVLDSELRVVYLEKHSTQHAVGLMMSRIGITAPMHCTALGRAMAAFRPEDEIRAWLQANDLKAYTDATITDEAAFLNELEEIRSRDYAVDNGEYEASVRCIAAPIRDRSGRVIAAVSISGPDTRMPPHLLGSSMAMQVMETASRISQALGYSKQLVAPLPKAQREPKRDQPGREGAYRSSMG
jgi:DNA-binding IclR family transcriptional regulator